ncbi:MAG: hypothetical protein RIR26_2461 [Pseudomonadota bacterium]
MNAVKALMGRALDYAGLFPPAKLPMNKAVEEFAACLNDPEAWFLARFVLPASRSGELVQAAGGLLAEAAQTRVPWHLSGLIRSAPSIAESLDLMRSETTLLRGLLDSHAGALELDALDLPVPDELSGTHDQELARSFFTEAYRIFAEAHFGVPVFWEVNLKKPFEHVALAAHNANAAAPATVCLKFRTGGLTPEAIVSPEILARAFRIVQQHRIPFKLTAGLHLALRHFDSAVGTDVFGFLNVFCAAVLGWTHNLSETELRLLLEEKNLAHIGIHADGIEWKSYRVSQSDIRQVRSVGLRSFGSCSFYEPVEEMKSMKLLS